MKYPLGTVFRPHGFCTLTYTITDYRFVLNKDRVEIGSFYICTSSLPDQNIVQTFNEAGIDSCEILTEEHDEYMVTKA